MTVVRFNDGGTREADDETYTLLKDMNDDGSIVDVSSCSSIGFDVCETIVVTTTDEIEDVETWVEAYKVAWFMGNERAAKRLIEYLASKIRTLSLNDVEAWFVGDTNIEWKRSEFLRLFSGLN